ncbi:mitochondrial ribosomal protein MRP51 [Astrocystis sublimbata]|nr:mitochondrial ribosomal protein MRP51 [Astrocystis sublimbata]
MAARSVSPGAALLRSSRMFSMPTPIPSSPGDYSSATKHHSATATAPYPTHLTITTPATSRANGDWGLKRPLPLKTTTKQTFPLVRIRQMDSVEHVTDFQSASDHTMTLKKFQELNLPITVPDFAGTSRNSDSPRSLKSVFEEDADVTALETLSLEQSEDIESKRWKFNGPWLAGMTDGAFQQWLEKNVRTRRTEFRAYLKNEYAKKLTEDQREQAVRDGTPEPPAVTPESVTESQFVDHLRDIRSQRMELYRSVSRFLDLAPLTTDPVLLRSMKVNHASKFNKENPYAVDGPPVTHPSAGLSYLRTPSFTDNHPIYGPQKYHPVVKARVLKPRMPNVGVHQPAIGIAGFVANEPTDQHNYNNRASNKRAAALMTLDNEARGGTKLYFKVEAATVDSGGRVRISIADPGGDVPEQVVQELFGEDIGEENAKMKVYSTARADGSASNISTTITRDPSGPGAHIIGSKGSYGL